MHYRLNQKKLEDQEIAGTLHISSLRRELEESIKYEEHRHNVDNAKKTAVKQLMDYDNFHQMVLGADLKSVKTNDMNELVGMADTRVECIYNTVGKGEDIDKHQFQDKPNFILPTSSSRKEDHGEEISDQFFQPSNFRDFKKLFFDLLTKRPTIETEVRLIEGVSRIDKDNYKKIFGLDFEIELIGKLIDILFTWNQDDELYKSQRSKITWFLQFLSDLKNLRTFKMSIKPLIKSAEKIILKKFLEKLQERNDALEEFIEEVRAAYLK